jgi:hypothetical protein
VLILSALVCNSSYASQVNVGVEEAFETALEYLKQNRIAEALLITDSLKKVVTGPLMLLEIGRIEFELGHYRAARATFEQAIDNFKLPKVTENRVEYYLEEIDLLLGSWSYAPSIKQVKNPNKKPQSDSYIVLGMPLSYTNDQNKNYWGIRHSFSYEKLYDSDWLLNSNFISNDFEGIHADTHALRFVLRDTQKQPSIAVDYSLDLEDGIGFNQRTFGVQVRKNTNGSVINHETSIGFYKIKHSQNQVLSGQKFEIGHAFRKPIGTSHYLLNTTFGKLLLKETSFSKNYMDITLSVHSTLQDFKLNPSVYRSFSQHEATDFLWGLRREDEAIGASIAVCKKPRFWTWVRFVWNTVTKFETQTSISITTKISQ